MLSKRHLQFTLLAALLLLTPIFAHDKCTHDDQEQPAPEIVDPETDNMDSEGRVLAGATSTYPNFRIKAYTGGLSNNTVFSTYVSNALIPPIVDYFGAALKVKYPLGNTFKMTKSSVCGVATPAELKTGVVGDFYWIIRDSLDESSWVADSYACNLMSTSKRPYIARTKINRYMFGATTDVLKHEKNIVCIMHELVHVLGFSKSLYGYFLDSNGVRQKGLTSLAPLNGVNTTVLNVEPLTSKLRAYFGCSTLQGAYMENTGGSGTTGSHFERRHFGHEIMTSGLIYEMAVSQFTLAVLEGSGWYQPVYTYAEPFYFGVGQGCSFLTDKCSPADHSEWCSGSARGCTVAGKAGGSCASDIRSDGCRFQHPNIANHCENSNAAANARFPTLEVFGRGAGSKCFTGSLAANTSKTATSTSYCLKYKCVTSGKNSAKVYKLNLTLGTTTATCTKAGPLTVAGYKGTITCPDPKEYCKTTGVKTCPRNCMGRGTCKSGVCTCKTGFTGTDCALGPNGL